MLDDKTLTVFLNFGVTSHQRFPKLRLIGTTSKASKSAACIVSVPVRVTVPAVALTPTRVTEVLDVILTADQIDPVTRRTQAEYLIGEGETV